MIMVQPSGRGGGRIRINVEKAGGGRAGPAGIKGRMAHIHEAPAGQNGGVAIPLAKKGDNEWAVPPGAKLSDEQFKAFKAGNLYVNVHNDSNKAGEIRGQFKP